MGHLTRLTLCGSAYERTHRIGLIYKQTQFILDFYTLADKRPVRLKINDCSINSMGYE